ncbi:MAG: hypothetical protein SVK08_13745 [Halobacteriota archaeon]|nr:hypothetical protein [Halobacteriota archaeon]
MAKLRNRILGGLLMAVGVVVLILYGLIPLLRWAIFELLIGFMGTSGLINLIIWIVWLVLGGIGLLVGLILFMRD